MEPVSTAKSVIGWTIDFFKEPGSNFMKRRLKEAKDKYPQIRRLINKITSLDWDHFAKKYQEHLKERYGYLNVFGLENEVALEKIYADVFLMKDSTLTQWVSLSSTQFQDKAKEKPTSIIKLFFNDQEKRLFVWGEPGSGKTTLLKHLIQETVRLQPEKIPIYIGLYDWQKSELSLKEYIATQIRLSGFPSQGLDLYVEFLLEEGRAVLFFDGLDEISDKARDDTNRNINEFCKRAELENVQCVITCRIGATQFKFDKYKNFRIAKWDNQRIKYFISKRFLTIERENFLIQLNDPKNKNIREFTSSPLLLSLLCWAFDPNSDLPPTKARIYQQATRHLIKERDQERSIVRDNIYAGLTLPQKEALYSELAFQTFEKGELSFDQFELEKKIAKILSEILGENDPGKIDGSKILEALVTQHGIIIPKSHGQYNFSHLTFQEYYAARYISDNAPKTWKTLVYYINDYRWHEIFLLAASLPGEKDEFFEIMYRGIGDLIRGKKQIMSIQQNVERKTKAIEYLQSGVVRSIYWFVILLSVSIYPEEKVIARVRASAIAHSLNSTIARTLDLAIARVLELNLGDALEEVDYRINGFSDYSNDFYLSIAIITARILDLGRIKNNVFDGLNYRDFRSDDKIFADKLEDEFALEVKIAQELGFEKVMKNIPYRMRHGAITIFLDILLSFTPDFAHIYAHAGKYEELITKHLNLVAYFNELQNIIESVDPEFANVFATLPLPPATASQEIWKKYEKDLCSLLIIHRDIGHHWQLSDEEVKQIKKYLEVTQLMVDCLNIATVRNRESIIAKILTVD